MSELKGIDKVKFERLFGMSSGYVLDFSNKTFQEFVMESTGLDIYDSKYDYGSGSKANQLRGFWQVESNYNVARLNFALLELWRTNNMLFDREVSRSEEKLYEECLKLAESLKNESIGEHLDSIQPNTDEKDFSVLANSIRHSIEHNEPEVALDRLHTFVVKYIRRLCDKHKINYDKNKALHSFFGEYIKHLKQENKIESEMTERILKSSISILESFNTVRNDKSFAHDNQILNYDESMLIFKNISSIIGFLESIENENIFDDEDDINNEHNLPF